MIEYAGLITNEKYSLEIKTDNKELYFEILNILCAAKKKERQEGEE